jgi:2-polyprenyl-3-methyl-5-hydroxy-6-metoxy-1,4-benzoquinol methylase
VEVNHVAAEMAASSGKCVFDSLDDIENGSIDVVISNHVVEHVAAPLDIAKSCSTSLSRKGWQLWLCRAKDTI